jgi:hypothetical protein
MRRFHLTTRCFIRMEDVAIESRWTSGVKGVSWPSNSFMRKNLRAQCSGSRCLKVASFAYLCCSIKSWVDNSAEKIGSHSSPLEDDVPTVAAIAILAFVFADIGHEVIGHGIGLLLTGHRSGMLTTTRLIEWSSLTQAQWRVFDLGGPVGNLVFAAAAIWSLRFIRSARVHLRSFLWLMAAFSLFWAFGYLIFCGATGNGDWTALVRGFMPAAIWRPALVLLGLIFYRTSMRFVADELYRIVGGGPQHWRTRAWRLVRSAYLFGGFIACSGAILDPRGRIEIINSAALTSFGGSLGLLLAPRVAANSGPRSSVAPAVLVRQPAWIVGALGASVLYVLVLGPGLRFSF